MTTDPVTRPPKAGAWLADLPFAAQLPVAAALGGLGALGQAPYGFSLLLLLAMILVFMMFRGHVRPARAGLTGWCFGTGYFLLAFVWILNPFQVDAARFGWMAPFALFFLAAGMALYWGLAFWAARRLSRGAWALALTWTGAELARAYLFTGFPWATPAQALVDGIAGQALAWVGPYGLMLWLSATALLLSHPPVADRQAVWRLGQAALLGVTALLIVVPPRAGPAPLSGKTVRLVQPNAPQHLKWQRDMIQVFYRRQLDLTAAAPAPGAPAPDLVVWSETAIPWMLEVAEPALEEIAAAAGGRPVVLGLQRREGVALYNSLAVLGPGGEAQQIYDKHHIVPFGEYLPLGDVLGRFGLRGLAASDGNGYSRGPGARLLDFGALGRGLPLICYEAVFAHDVNAAAARPDFLIQITNDAWFGQDAGPQQHLAQARMRAIEQGLPLMRSANTGISAMIDPWGRVTHSIALNVAGFVDAPLPSPSARTLYSRTGDGPLALLLAAVVLGAAWRRRAAHTKAPNSH